MNTLQTGQSIWLEMAGERCEILELAGSGSRSQVYRVSLEGIDYALKWYFPESATTTQREAIERLIRKGAPNDRFLWPMDIALCQGMPSFGYLMPWREARYHSLAQMMNREVDPTFRTLTSMAIELADTFLRLHSVGLCFLDISFGHIFLDPVTGEILICDNDTVAADGESIEGIVGSPRFMPPEIVSGAAKPDACTDLHALAVIFFYIFMMHHPLEGRREREIQCLDAETLRKLCGPDALFIFDPKHGNNRPVAGTHNNAPLFWNFYPDYVRDIFVRAFTKGLLDPQARVRESEWRAVFTRMRDQIFYCGRCGAENFLANDGETPGLLAEQECWSCREVMAPSLRLRLGQHSIALNQDTLLYAHHLDANRRNDYSEVFAEMVPHPTRPDLWGLRNVSAQAWTVVAPSGATTEVSPDRSVSLVPGLRIKFGKSEGTVR